ncbi:MAG: helix-turn-helix transcriptional regulator [Oscillospiraceae bacterium]|nr:helix-turn-helix transcriptional regulator [Oscillospiraceae bacterium]
MTGLRIAYFRKEKGWTQEELANRMKMQTSTIGAIEAPNMDKKISLNTLFKFAKVLDVPASKLLEF